MSASEETVLERIGSLARPLIEEMGYEPYHLELKRGGGRTILRVYIDRSGGVGLGDCEAVSRRLGACLENEDSLSDAYVLEVSSPGLDRPLVDESHYRRFSGRRARLRLVEPLDGRRQLKVTILACEGGVLRFADEGGREMEVPLSRVAQGRLEVEI